MEWIPVQQKLPRQGSSVLVTVKTLPTKQLNVVACVYGALYDLETGEVTGSDTFYIAGSEALLDLNDKRDFQVLAWSPLPKPYKEKFRVIVAGSRSFSNYALLCKKLDKVFENHKPDAIVCGLAKGADLLGKRYAEERGIKVEEYPANWEGDGKQAGYLRNEKMACNAEACVAFWNGKSSGTKHMIETAKAKGLQVRVVKFEN